MSWSATSRAWACAMSAAVTSAGTTWLSRNRGILLTPAQTRLIQEPAPGCPDRDLRERAQLESGQNMSDVGGNRALAHQQLPRDASVRIPSPDQFRHLALTMAESFTSQPLPLLRPAWRDCYGFGNRVQAREFSTGRKGRVRQAAQLPSGALDLLINIALFSGIRAYAGVF